MMNDPLDDLLDARLREETPYIDDAGFTARVMKELPRRRGAAPQTQRSLIIFFATVFSVVIAFFASGEGMFMHDAFAQLTRLTPFGLFVLLLVIGLVTSASGLWAACNRVRAVAG